MLELLAVGDVQLAGLVAMTASRWPGRPVSERVATIERLVWELLQTGAVELLADGGSEPVPPPRWREVLLALPAWGAQGAAIRRRPR